MSSLFTSTGQSSGPFAGLQPSDDSAHAVSFQWVRGGRKVNSPWKDGVLWSGTAGLGRGIGQLFGEDGAQYGRWEDDNGDVGTGDEGITPYLLTKTTEWMHNTKITQLATNTTIPTATTYTTETQTIYVPETGERRFLSVRLVMFVRSEFAVTGNSITGVRAQVQLGSAAALTFDQVLAWAATANRNIVGEVEFDFTDYFNVNFGSGTSQTVAVTTAVATTTASNVNGITFRWCVTYAFDPAATNTRIKTIRIPIQSCANGLTTAQLELGTDGTCPQPTGAIPALDTFLPEASKTYRKIFLDLHSNDSGGAATNFTPQLQIDALAAVARATIDETLQTNMYWRDQYDLTGAITTNATHTVSMASDTVTTNRMTAAGGFLFVCYEYDHAATVSGGTAIYEAMVPFTQSSGKGDNQDNPYDGLLSVNDLKNYQRQVAVLDVQEPGTPTIVQSAIVSIMEVESSVGVFTKRAGQQAIRTSTPLAASAGTLLVVHRIDTNSSMVALARGQNRITYDLWGTGRSAQCTAYALVNYTAGIRSDVDRGNHVTNFMQRTSDPSNVLIGIDQTRNAPSRKPEFGNKPWKINGAIAWANLDSGIVTMAYALEQMQGESMLDGGYSLTSIPTTTQATQVSPILFPFTQDINVDSLHVGKIDITKRRRQILSQSSAGMSASWSLWFTSHNHSFTVSDTVLINGAAPADGKTVEVYAVDGNGVSDLVTTCKTTGGTGTFSALVPDNTRSYFASYNNDGFYGRSSMAAPV